VIVVLIPAYNASATIAELIFRLRDVAIKNPQNIMVYDDGSTDATAYIAEKCGAYVIRGETNRGKGYALKRLFQTARERYKLMHSYVVFVTMDADLQHDPQDIPRLIKPILQGRADVVFGVRDPESIPKWRRFGNRILDILTGGRGGKETQCGFRAYSWRALERIRVEAEGFAVNGEIYRQVKADQRLRCIEVPVSTRYNRYSHTKSPVTHFLEIINFIFLRKPLRNLGLLGSAASVLGLLGIVEVVRRWSVYHELALGTFLAAVLLVILGAFTFYTGVILHVLTSRRV